MMLLLRFRNRRDEFPRKQGRDRYRRFGGIGAHLASILSQRGALLSVAARNESRLRERFGKDAVISAGDLTTQDARSALIANTLERHGRIDVLINNAGRGSYYPVSTTPLDEARALFDLNFFAPLALAQLAVPHLRSSHGTLVNVSSIAGQIPLPWLPVYSASKAALASITSTERDQLTRDGIAVIGVFPGVRRYGVSGPRRGPAPPGAAGSGKAVRSIASGLC